MASLLSLSLLNPLAPAWADVPPGAAAVSPIPQVFADLAEKAMPSVVNISTVTLAKGRQDLMELPGFYPFPKRRDGATPRSAALGTGFVIDASAWGKGGPQYVVLTNNHVVADADEIKLAFTEDPSEKPTSGEVIGRDAELDIAVIRVDAASVRKLVPLPLGDSDRLRVGEYVAAIGNPFGQGHSISHGIVSAKGRTAPELPLATYLQTDAPINPGNSGGPLLNLRGEVVAINNAIDARAQGIGFAIPVNAVKAVLPQLIGKGSVSRGYLGVVVEPLQPELARKLGAGASSTGVLVRQVQPRGPAARAGLEAYDIITAVAGRPIATPNDLTQGVTANPVGKTVSVTVLREGRSRNVDVKLGNRASES